MTEEEKDTAEDVESAIQDEETAESGDEDAAEGAEAEQEQPKEKKKKKVVRRRKTKKERENVLTAAVRLAVESGKVDFGARSGVAAGAEGKAKLFVIANNTPPAIRAKVEGLANSSKVPVIEYEGSSMELGSVCGKPFPVSVLSIFEAGSSNLMEFAKKK